MKTKIDTQSEQQKPRTMQEIMKCWIFYKIFLAQYECLKQLSPQAIAEINKLKNPPVLVAALVEAVAAIFGIAGDFSTVVQIVHPENLKRMHMVNIVEIRRENLLPWRNFSAKFSLADMASKSKAAAELYRWAQNVDDLYKMTNKEEFAYIQEKKIMCAAQSPTTKLRQFFKQGSFFSKPSVELDEEEKIMDINTSPDLSPVHNYDADAFPEQTQKVGRDSDSNLDFFVNDEDLRTKK